MNLQLPPPTTTPDNPLDNPLQLTPHSLPLWQAPLQHILSLLELKNPLSNPELITQLATCPLLHFNILRLANSPTYSPFGQQILNLPLALQIIGPRHLSNLCRYHPTLSPSNLLSKYPSFSRELLKTTTSSHLLHSLSTPSSNPLEPPLSLLQASLHTLLHRMPNLITSFHSPDTWDQIESLLRNKTPMPSAYSLSNINLHSLKQSLQLALTPLPPTSLPEHHLTPLISSYTDTIFDTSPSDPSHSTFAQHLNIPLPSLLHTLQSSREKALSSLAAPPNTPQHQALLGLNTNVQTLKNLLTPWTTQQDPVPSSLRNLFNLLNASLNPCHSLFLTKRNSTLHTVLSHSASSPLPPNIHSSIIHLPSNTSISPPQTLLSCATLSPQPLFLTHPFQLPLPPDWSFTQHTTEILIIPILKIKKETTLPPAFTFDQLHSLPHNSTEVIALIYLDWTRFSPSHSPFSKDSKSNISRLVQTIQSTIAQRSPS